MKFIRTIFSLIIYSTLLIQNTYGQQNNIESEILKYEDTNLMIITKSRKLIIDKILTNDIQKVSEIVNYLNTKFDKSKVIIFWESELWLLSFWTKDYRFLLDSAKKYTPKQETAYSNKIYPSRDLFYMDLRALSIKNHDNIYQNIMSSDIERFEKDFLCLLFEHFLSSDDEKYITQNEINVLATEYIETYTNSYLNPFVMNYIRFIIQPSKWGLGFDFSTGYAAFNNNLNKYFSPSIPLNVAFDIQYEKIITNARIYIGVGGDVKKEFDYEGHWKKDLKLNIYLPELSFGYEIINNSTFKIYPFIGLASMNISPPDKIAEEPGNDVDLGFVFTSIYGLNIDIKLKESHAGIIGRSERGNWFLRLRLGITDPSYENKIYDFIGNMYYIQIGIGGFARKLIRVL